MLERAIALFFHLLGVIGFFTAIILVQLSGRRLREVATVEEIRTWLSVEKVTQPMFPITFGVILLSGLYMTVRMWSFHTPWIAIGLVSLIAVALLGSLVVARGLARIGKAATGTGPVPAELAGMIREPRIWVVQSTIQGMVTGVIWIMVSKSGWIQSIAVVGIFAALGILLGARPVKPATR